MAISLWLYVDVMEAQAALIAQVICTVGSGFSHLHPEDFSNSLKGLLSDVCWPLKHGSRVTEPAFGIFLVPLPMWAVGKIKPACPREFNYETSKCGYSSPKDKEKAIILLTFQRALL